MRNSDRFLVAFNSIETSLKEFNSDGHYVPFSRLIQLARKSNAIVNRFYDDLKEYSELRNAIVHNTVDVNYAIAEPHESIVKKIEFIEQELSQPKRVIPLFEKKVTAFQSNNTLTDILYVIKQYDFSKFPIYDRDKFIGLLSKKGIVNWLAENVTDLNNLSFSEILLKDVMLHEKQQRNFRFIHKNVNIYEVKDIFKSIIEKESPRIDALLITEHGKPDEPLLGIVTPWDVIELD